MDFTVGEYIEAVDQFGVWANARVVEKRDDSVVVTFPHGSPNGTAKLLMPAK